MTKIYKEPMKLLKKKKVEPKQYEIPRSEKEKKITEINTKLV